PAVLGHGGTEPHAAGPGRDRMPLATRPCFLQQPTGGGAPRAHGRACAGASLRIPAGGRREGPAGLRLGGVRAACPRALPTQRATTTTRPPPTSTTVTTTSTTTSTTLFPCGGRFPACFGSCPAGLKCGSEHFLGVCVCE